MCKDGRKVAIVMGFGVGLICLVYVLTKPAKAAPLLVIQVVDLDSDNNGIVDEEDEAAFLAAYPSTERDLNYDRQFDANFDDVIDNKDYDIFYHTMGKNLNIIRDSIKTGVYEHLTWPDGWNAYLVALNKDKIDEFTGWGHLDKEGWISVRHHPYYPYSPEYYGYVCRHSAFDTAVAAYRGLGYGCLLFSYSPKHAYNIFWVGGDWHDLNNWYILETQSGGVFPAGRDHGAPYQTELIMFFDYMEPGIPSRSDKTFNGHCLNVDYEARTVSFGNITRRGVKLYSIRGPGIEEPPPSSFDRAYLVGV